MKIPISLVLSVLISSNCSGNESSQPASKGRQQATSNSEKKTPAKDKKENLSNHLKNNTKKNQSAPQISGNDEENESNQPDLQEDQSTSEGSSKNNSATPPKNPICKLPKDTGPCRAAKPAYFFNAQTHNCERFLYGGCRGNGNRFASKAECEAACPSSPALNLTEVYNGQTKVLVGKANPNASCPVPRCAALESNAREAEAIDKERCNQAGGLYYGNKVYDKAGCKQPLCNETTVYCSKKYNKIRSEENLFRVYKNGSQVLLVLADAKADICPEPLCAAPDSDAEEQKNINTQECSEAGGEIMNNKVVGLSGCPLDMCDFTSVYCSKPY